MSSSLRPHGLYSPSNSPGQNTGVGSLPLLWRSSQPMDQIQVSHFPGRFFTSWATRDVPKFKFLFKEVVSHHYSEKENKEILQSLSTIVCLLNLCLALINNLNNKNNVNSSTTQLLKRTDDWLALLQNSIPSVYTWSNLLSKDKQ